MLTIDALKAFGADTDDGLNRCMGNEMLYFRFIKMAVADPGFERLAEAAAAGDLNGAFEAAHALKGVFGNLSLTPLYEDIAELTELLRAHVQMDYNERISAILVMRDELKALCEV